MYRVIDTKQVFSLLFSFFLCVSKPTRLALVGEGTEIASMLVWKDICVCLCCACACAIVASFVRSEQLMKLLL